MQRVMEDRQSMAFYHNFLMWVQEAEIAFAIFGRKYACAVYMRANHFESFLMWEK